MRRIIETWSVQKILNLLYNNQLNYKPNIQRQFVYKPQQQQQVIMSIKRGFLAASLVVEMDAPGSYVLLDGKQRINSIIGFINRAFTLDTFYFSDAYRLDRPNPADRFICPHIISEEIPSTDLSDSATLLRFEFPVVIYTDMQDSERLVLFNVINTTGEKLNTWELLNGRYPSGVLLDMRQSFFNEKRQTNTTTLDTNNIKVKKYEKYFGTHDVNRGELYEKIIEKLFVMYGGTLEDDQPYEIVDGIQINTRNYNRLCRFVETHNQEWFTIFAQELNQKLDLFYEMFADVANLGALKEACFRIGEYDVFQQNEQQFKTDRIKTNLAFLITQYNNSDVRQDNNHERYFEDVLLPMALVMKDAFLTTLDTRRFFTPQDRELIFYANATLNPATRQVLCQGVYNDGVTPCGCGRYITLREATVDHITPWILGGRTTQENAQLLCHDCNCKKNSTIILRLLYQNGEN